MWLMARLAPQLYGNATPKVAEADQLVSFEIHTTPEPQDVEGEGDDDDDDEASPDATT